jgi:hypothetical protein
MHKDTPRHFDESYSNESDLLESLYEFHPEFFDELSPEEFSTLQTYYLFATATSDYPKNVFEYRQRLLKENPSLENRAQEVYKKLLRIAKVK